MYNNADLKGALCMKKTVLTQFILIVLSAVFSFFTMYNFRAYTGNSMLFVIIFMCIYFVLKNVQEWQNKRKFIFISIVSAIFSVVNILGLNIATKGTLDNVIDEHIVVNLIGYFTVAYIFINFMFKIFESKIENKKIVIKNHEILGNNILSFVICFVIMILAWLPYFLTYYPGILTYDSVHQIYQVQNIEALSDHHPIMHTAFIAIFVKIGIGLFNSINVGVALASIAQMIIMALAFSFVLKYMAKKNVNIFIRILALIFYAFYPVNGLYSITMWKDVLFGICVPVFVVFCIDLIQKPDEFLSSKKNVILYILISFFTIVVRHNGFYVFWLSVPFIFIVLRKYWKKLIIIFGTVLVLNLLFNIIIFNVLKAKKGDIRESLSIPVQQIARTQLYHGGEFDDETIKQINNFFGTDNIGNLYNPNVSDNVKGEFNSEYFSENKGDFIKLWLKLLVEYPREYIASFVAGSYGYYYPEAFNWVSTRTVDTNTVGIEQNGIIEGKLLRKYDGLIDRRGKPLVSMLFSIGFLFWVLVTLLLYKVYEKKYIYLLIYLPLMILWLTLIASPVYCEYRYAYPLFTTFPLLAGMNFIDDKNKSKE